MRNMRPAVLALLSILAISTSAPAEEYELQYRYVQKPSREGVHGSTGKMEVLDSAPKGVALPQSAGSEPVFCKWKTPLAKDGFIYVAFARSGRNPWRDRIVVDANCDGKLADETPAEPFMTQGRMDFSHYGPIEVKFPAAEGTTAYHATFSLYASVPSQRAAWVRSSCCHETALTLDDVTYKVALVDGNANGTFDDMSTDLTNIDYVAFPSKGGCEHRCVGKYIDIGGKLYQLKVARDGSRIELSPAGNVATGKVRTKGYVTTLILAGENGELSFDLVENKTAVPVGTWIVEEWTYDGDKEKGKAPAFGDYRFGSETTFVVAAGMEVQIDVGASTTTTADLTKATNLDSVPGGASLASTSEGGYGMGVTSRLLAPRRRSGGG